MLPCAGEEAAPAGDAGGSAAGVFAMLRLLPVLRDPSVALKEQLWKAPGNGPPGEGGGQGRRENGAVRAEEVCDRRGGDTPRSTFEVKKGRFFFDFLSSPAFTCGLLSCFLSFCF